MKKAKKIFLSVAGLTLLFGGRNVLAEDYAGMTENFEEYEIGDSFLDIYADSDLYKNINELDSINVDVDEETNQKALKFEIENNTDVSKTSIHIPFGAELKTGIYSVSFDFKAENNSRYVSKAGQVYNSRSQSEILPEILGDSFYYDSYADGMGSIAIENEWINVRYEINLDERTYDTFINKEKVSNDTPLKRNTTKGIDRVVFEIYGKSGCNGSATGKGIYWVDNISVEKVTLDIKESNIKNLSDGVGIDEEIILNFNSLPDEATISDEMIELYENDKKISFSYSINDATLKIIPENGMNYFKKYKVVLKSGIKACDNKYGILEKEYVLEFETESVVNIVNLKDGDAVKEGFRLESDEFEWISYSYYLDNKLFDISEVVENGVHELKILAFNSENNKEELKIINFEVVGNEAPSAENVRISGEAYSGSEITVLFDYSDRNGDDEGEHIYKWYSSEEIDGEYVEISGADEKSYILDKGDENKYIKASVQPVAINEPYSGKEVFSDVFLGAFSPEVSDVAIDGEKELTGKYTYFDKNNDVEGESSFAWYRFDSKSENKEVVSTDKKYLPGEEDIDGYLIFGVIPKSVKEPYDGREYYSEKYYLPSSPYVTDVKIKGKTSKGNTLTAEYVYCDDNNDMEGNTYFKWYVNDELYSDETYLTITSQMVGKSVYCVVTPVSKEFPYKGKEVKSNVLNIPKTSSSSGGGFSGGGSGYVSKDPQKQEETPKEENENRVGKTFVDIEGHWAKEIVEKMAEKKIINGINDTEFSPDTFITRAQVAAIMERAFGLTTAEECRFDDVLKEEWYYNCVSSVYGSGVMKGYNGMFRPNDPITREELMNVLYNYSGNKNVGGFELSFGDETEISDWARDAVVFLVENAIISGNEKGQLKPKGKATRAETAAMILRFIEFTEG